MSQLQFKSSSELSDAKRLTQQLTYEFDHNFDDDKDGREYRQPLINEEAALGRILLLVIWDAWRPFSQQERSRIIIDAYEASQGSERALRVTTAMGLTQDDASHLGVDFVPAPM